MSAVVAVVGDHKDMSSCDGAQEHVHVASLLLPSICYHHMSGIMRKPVFRFLDQVGHKLGFTASEDG